MLRKRKTYVNLLVKPTNGCNLRCKYCFSNNYKVDSLDIKSFEKLINLISREADELQIVWHGGEPTLWGYENFKKAFDVIKKYSNKMKIRQGLQTNGIHIEDRLIDLLIENDVSIGSSFDGLYNDSTRGGTEKYLDTIDKLKKRGKKVGAICVITRETTEKLIENYEYFKKREQSLNLRPMIESGEALNNKDVFSVDVDLYIKELKKLLKHWFLDTKCNISLQPFEMYIDMLLYKNAGKCCYDSCIGNWFCLEPNGNITPCNRWFPSEFTYGNISNLKKFKNLYKSEGMKQLLKLAIARRERCKKGCELFDVCKGGCNNEALVNGNIENNNMPSCKILKEIMSEIKNVIIENQEIDKINPKIKTRVELYLKNKQQNGF